MTTAIVATPCGRDTSATSRIHAGRVVSGGQLLGEAAYRRLVTEPGSLLYDLDYGLGITRWLGRAFTPDFIATIPGQIRNELKKDPRIDSVETTMTTVRAASGAVALTLTIVGAALEGDGFELVLHIDDVTVELLKVAANG